MSNLVSNYLKDFTTDSWQARTYAEYMESAANETLQLVSDITDLSVADNLEDLINSKSDTIGADIDSVNKEVQDALMRSGIKMSDISKDSEEYLRALDATLSSPEHAEFKHYLTVSLALDYDDIVEHWNDRSLDDYISADPDILSLLNDSVDGMMSSNHLSGKQMLFNDGFYDLKEVCLSAIKDLCFNRKLNIEDTLQMTNYNDVISSVKRKGIDFINLLKSSAASGISWAAGISACLSENLTEAFETYSAKIGTVINDVSMKFASSVNHVKGVISDVKGNISDFVSTMYVELGWKQVHDDLFTSVEGTQVWDFTGSSPIISLDFKALADGAVAVGKTILAAAYGVFEGLRALIKPVISKLKTFFKALSSNPNDIRVENELDDSHTITNYCYTNTESHIKFTTQYDSSVDYYHQKTIVEKLRNLLNEHILGKFIGLDTYAFQLGFEVTTFSYSIGDDGNHYVAEFDLTCKYKYKPKCLNYSGLLQYGIIHKVTSYNTIQSRLNNNITAWRNFVNAGDIYNSSVSEEEPVFMGFVSANLIASSMSSGIVSELNPQMLSSYGFNFKNCKADGYNLSVSGSQYPEYDYTSQDVSSLVPDTVTNLDFIMMCSGATVDGSSFSTFYHKQKGVSSWDHPSYAVPISLNFGNYILSWIYQQYDKNENSTDYLYLPYTNGTWDLSVGTYAVLTDSQNSQLASLLVAVIVIVTIVAVTAVTLKIVSKVIRNRRIARLYTRNSQMDADIWDGYNMTASDARRYMRTSRKLDKLTSATSGFVGSEDGTSSILDSVGQIKNYLGMGPSSGSEHLNNLSDQNISYAILKAINNSSNT